MTATPKGTPEEEASFWICPFCGPRIACDEDGCCATCGSTSFGSEEEWYLEIISSAVSAERERCLAIAEMAILDAPRDVGAEYESGCTTTAERIAREIRDAGGAEG